MQMAEQNLDDHSKNRKKFAEAIRSRMVWASGVKEAKNIAPSLVQTEDGQSEGLSWLVVRQALKIFP